MITFLEVLLSFLVFAALAAGAIWKCAEVGFLWTFVQRNHIILFDRGKGNPFKVLIYEPPEEHPWYSPLRYGIHWVGFIAVEIHEFPLIHERVNTKVNKDTDHENWLVKDTKATMERHLLKTVVHWAYVPGFEFAGAQRADILLQYQATVAGEAGAQTAVYDREGKFFDDLGAVIESNVISLKRLRGMTYERFIEVEKDANSDLMVSEDPDNLGLLHEANKTAAQRSGYSLDSIFVFRFDASSKAEEKLAREKMTARILAEAARIKARGEVADVTELIKMIKRQLPNADQTVIMEAVKDLGVAKRLADSKNLQAVGGAMLGIQPKNNGKRGKNK